MNADIRKKIVSKIKNDADGRAQYTFEYEIERYVVLRFYWKWEKTVKVFLNENEKQDLTVTDKGGTRPTITQIYDAITNYIERSLT